ncbi:MAG: DUF2934 domain-containing protein [Nitrospira sp.]|jgi:hypothetical protein|nr:DUF2934 domain-containing protein [Nitrospira sp.]
MTAMAKKQSGSSAARAARRPGAGKPIELPDGMRDRIAQKAYELWEERGRRAGRDLEDWLDAEAIVMEEIHEARE